MENFWKKQPTMLDRRYKQPKKQEPAKTQTAEPVKPLAEEGNSPKNKARIALTELFLATPVLSACNFMDPKDEWFSTKLVGMILGALTVLAIAEYAVKEYISRKQEQGRKQQ